MFFTVFLFREIHKSSLSCWSQTPLFASNELNAGTASSLHFDYIWIRLANRKILTRLINSVANYLVLESESLKGKTGTREWLTIYSRMNDIFKLSRNFSSLQVSGRTDSVWLLMVMGLAEDEVGWNGPEKNGWKSELRLEMEFWVGDENIIYLR